MKIKKIHLVPISEIRSSKESRAESWMTASFHPKYGTLRFSKEYSDQKGMDKAFLRMFADAKAGIIAWSRIQRGEELKASKGAIRQARAYGKGAVMVTVPKKSVLAFLGMTKDSPATLGARIESHTDALIGQVDLIRIARKHIRND